MRLAHAPLGRVIATYKSVDTTAHKMKVEDAMLQEMKNFSASMLLSSGAISTMMANLSDDYQSLLRAVLDAPQQVKLIGERTHRDMIKLDKLCTSIGS